MDNKIKIKISQKAYDKLLNILKEASDNSYIRFSYKNSCCGSSLIDILIDNYKINDIKDNIDRLPVLYNSEVVENIKEIILVYKNSSFMIKTIPVRERIKNCSACTVGCKNNKNCSSCK